MRIFLAWFFTIWALTVIAVLAVAGFRGSMSRRPPIEIFPDMDRQPKLRPQTTTKFSGFADGLSSRLAVAGTIARDSHYADTPENTGKIAGTTNFVEAIPVPINAQLMKRGQERFNIYCQPCHGLQGDGKGIISRFGMGNVANLHQDKLIKTPDGDLFVTITLGKNTMKGYGAQIHVSDRWAIVAYVRALQVSHYGAKGDVPADQLSKIK